jgi:hypothetical protein
LLGKLGIIWQAQQKDADWLVALPILKNISHLG